MTGGTGMLGNALTRKVLDLDPDAHVVWLVRAPTESQAEARLKDAPKFLRDSGRLKILRCDLSRAGLGLNRTQRDSLQASTTHIVHAAATTKFTHPLPYARRNNVKPAGHLAEFAQCCSQLQKFGHISTAFVAGRRTGTILEVELEHEEGFLNTYQQSKYEAEQLLNRYTDSLPITIFRPSLIVAPPSGSHRQKHAPQNAFLIGVSLLRRGLLPILPGTENSRMDIINLEYAATAISKLLLEPATGRGIYHITNGRNAPTLKDMLMLIEHMSGHAPKVELVGGPDSFARTYEDMVRHRPELAAGYEQVSTFLPELSYSKVFDNSHLLDSLKEYADPVSTMADMHSFLR